MRFQTLALVGLASLTAFVSGCEQLDSNEYQINSKIRVDRTPKASVPTVSPTPTVTSTPDEITVNPVVKTETEQDFSVSEVPSPAAKAAEEKPKTQNLPEKPQISLIKEMKIKEIFWDISTPRSIRALAKTSQEIALVIFRDEAISDLRLCFRIDQDLAFSKSNIDLEKVNKAVLINSTVVLSEEVDQEYSGIDEQLLVELESLSKENKASIIYIVNNFDYVSPNTSCPRGDS